MKISIILVHYHVPLILEKCIRSILLYAKDKVEIIVVDNDEIGTIETTLLGKFPQVSYIKSAKNVGYGAANNIGAKKATGKYIFFLNPDTIIYKNTLDNLITFLDSHDEAAVVAPLLQDAQRKVYNQGTLQLTPLRAIFSISIINKIFPNNSIAAKYTLNDWDKKSLKEVDVVPGTAFVIRKDIFNKIGGFDKNFFLYFEEFDLCKRLRDRGYRLFILPQAKVQHWGGESTKHSENIHTIFEKSRFLYFKKHFGYLSAFVTTIFLQCNKYTGVVFLSLCLGSFVALYRLRDLMPFIGDYGWFYISANNLLHYQEIPLVGIATSHPWLHQGPIWTYFLAFVLRIYSLDPLAGGYLSIGFFLLSILMIYKLGTNAFSTRVGAIATFLYATSPLIIITARSPYHTSPIPFFTIIYCIALIKWLRGNRFYFPIIVCTLSILYNLELATFPLTILFICIFLYGCIKKKEWVKIVNNKKVLILSLLSLFPMIPMFLYDIGHGYPQTIKFFLWSMYKIALVFGFPVIHPVNTTETIRPWVPFFVDNYQKLVFLPNLILAITLGLSSLVNLLFVRNTILCKNKMVINILLLVFLIEVSSILIAHTPSDAYLPELFPIMIIFIAVLFHTLIQKYKKISTFIYIFLIFIGLLNIYSLISNNYYIPHGWGYSDKIAAAKKIVSEADGRGYNIKGIGSGSEFESFTMQYEYITIWLGHPPSHIPEKTIIMISEENNTITISKKVIK